MSAVAAGPRAMGKKVELLARDIKLGHSVFALPWAILATFLAGRTLPGGLPRWGQVALIVVCMVSARTLAMVANRLIDARLDALNPRTAGRAIAAGAISRAFAVAAIVVCAAVFNIAAWGFLAVYGNPWPIIWANPVLLFLGAYPLLKRFSGLCHYYLGVALALAPVCAYVAIAGTLAAPPLWMAGAVWLWTAGFDIIYACQDFDSDRATGVYSVPARIGVGPALWAARLTHAGAMGFLIVLATTTAAFGGIFAVAVALAGGLLIAEHALVRADDLSRVNVAFFTLNGVMSLLIGGLGVIDLFV